MLLQGRAARPILATLVLLTAVLSAAGCGVSPVPEVLPEQSDENGTADPVEPAPDPPAPDGPAPDEPVRPVPKPAETLPLAPPPEDVVEDAVLPDELLGLWTSIDQGDAETIYRFTSDGSYDQASVLLQARATGTFSFSLAMTGLASVDGDQLLLTPTGGTQTRRDPDDPAGDFDRPVTDLAPEQFSWWMDDGHLVLEGQYGVVEYEWSPDE
jgi:hypothetical protein